MIVSERLGLNLRRARRRGRMSEDEFSRRTGLHHSEISLLERGVRIPRLDTAIKVLESAGADPTVLFEGIGRHAPAHRDEKGWFTVAGIDGPVEVRPPRRAKQGS